MFAKIARKLHRKSKEAAKFRINVAPDNEKHSIINAYAGVHITPTKRNISERSVWMNWRICCEGEEIYNVRTDKWTKANNCGQTIVHRKAYLDTRLMFYAFIKRKRANDTQQQKNRPNEKKGQDSCLRAAVSTHKKGNNWKRTTLLR